MNQNYQNMTIPKPLRSKLRSGLRKLWLFFGQNRKLAIAQGKISRGTYQCQSCKLTLKAKQYQIDHINPAGAFTTYAELGKFIENLFENKCQLLCYYCHLNKK